SLLHHEVDRNNERYRRRKSGGKNPEREVAFARKGKTRKPICRHRTEDDCQEGADRANNDAIDKIGDGTAAAEDKQRIVEALKGGFKIQNSRQWKKGGLRLECGCQNHEEGK